MMEIYTPEQVAEMLSVGVFTIREWLRNGTLKGSKIGSLWRITRADIEDMMAANKYKED